MKNKWHYAHTTQDMTDFIVQEIAQNIAPEELISHINSVTDIVFSSDGSKFISGSLYGKDKTCSNLFMWDTKTCNRLLKLKINPEEISTVSFSPNGQQIVISCGGDKNNLAIWDVHTGTKIFDLIENDSPASSAIFTPDGKKIISVDSSSRESDITVWNARTGKKLFNIDHKNNLSCNRPQVVLSPDGMKIAAFCAGGEYRDISVIDTHTGTILFKISNPTHNTTTLQFSPDNTKIVSSNTDKSNNIHIWDACTGEKLITIEGHHYSTHPDYLNIRSLQFSPNGKYIASTNWEDRNNFILWNAYTGEKVFDLIGHHDRINEVIFTPDNNYLISSCSGEEGSIIIWDIYSGKKVVNILNHPQYIWSLALSPNGTTLVAGGYKKTDNLVMWKVPFDLITTVRKDLNKKQTELLYNHYRATENEVDFTTKMDSPDYAIYQSLPDVVKKAIHQKNNESFFYQLERWLSRNALRLEIIINKTWEKQRFNCRQKILLLQRKIKNLLLRPKNKLEFLTLTLSTPSSTTYSYQDASNIEMCILERFIADYCSSNTSSAKEWILDEQFTEGGGNSTWLEEENGYILVTDMYSEEELPTVLKLSNDQLIKLLDDWQEKVLDLKPKEVTINYQYDKFTIETKN